MKATEILEQLKNVFLSADNTEVQEVEETQELSQESVEEVQEEAKEELSEVAVEEVTEEVKATEEVELAEEVTEEPVKEEEAPAEAQPMVSIEFATKEDLSSLKSEMLDILSKLEEIRKEYKKDVPAELSEQKEELSEEVTEIAHSPESMIEESKSVQFSTNRTQTTQDRVFSKLFKK